MGSRSLIYCSIIKDRFRSYVSVVARRVFSNWLSSLELFWLLEISTRKKTSLRLKRRTDSPFPGQRKVNTGLLSCSCFLYYKARRVLFDQFFLHAILLCVSKYDQTCYAIKKRIESGMDHGPLENCRLIKTGQWVHRKISLLVIYFGDS